VHANSISSTLLAGIPALGKAGGKTPLIDDPPSGVCGEASEPIGGLAKHQARRMREERRMHEERRMQEICMSEERMMQERRMHEKRDTKGRRREAAYITAQEERHRHQQQGSNSLRAAHPQALFDSTLRSSTATGKSQPHLWTAQQLHWTIHKLHHPW
jgi:hypothetical protein